MIPPRFEYKAPRSLEEAVSILSNNPDDSKVLAGGQSLISVLKFRLATPKLLVDIGRIPGLNYVRKDGDTIAIGAMTTYAEALASQLIKSECPLLVQAASVVGDIQIRNRGTVGGAIAHADAAGDVPAAVLALDGQVKAIGPKGERLIPVTEFFQGFFATALAPDEILTEVRIPIPKGCKSAYIKNARRPSDFAIVGIAVSLRTAGNGTCEKIAIGVTGLADDKPYRAKAVEAQLTGKKLDSKTIQAAAPAITDGVDVGGNMHASPEFRTRLAQVYLERTILSVS